MSHPTDLAPLMSAPVPVGSAQPMGYRQGIVVAWDPLTAENTILVGGEGGGLLTNVAVLNTSEALLLTPGAVVGLMTAGSTWAIMGRLTIPGTPDASSALSMLTARMQADSAIAMVSTTSTSYVSLDSGRPSVSDVLITQTGRCLVFLAAETVTGTAIASSDIEQGSMSLEVTGPTGSVVVTPDGLRAYEVGIATGTGPGVTFSADPMINACNAILLGPLTPGFHSFESRYSSVFGGTAQFSNRRMIVMPF